MKKQSLAVKLPECKANNMWQDIQAAIPLGILLSFMIGPVFFVLIETSAVKGFRAALSFDLGVIIADIFFITVAYFSSFQLLENLSNQPGLYVFGGVILIIYGVTTFFKKNNKNTPRIKPRGSDYLSLFLKGFLLNFINIGVLVFWMGVIIIVGPSLENNPKRMIVFFSSVLGIYLAVDVLKIILAKQLKKKLTRNRITLVKKILGIALIIFGVILVIKGFLPKDRFNPEKGMEIIKERTSDL